MKRFFVTLLMVLAVLALCSPCLAAPILTGSHELNVKYHVGEFEYEIAEIICLSLTPDIDTVLVLSKDYKVVDDLFTWDKFAADVALVLKRDLNINVGVRLPYREKPTYYAIMSVPW